MRALTALLALGLFTGASGCRSKTPPSAPAATDGAQAEAPVACGRPNCPEVVYRRDGNNLIRGIEVDATDVYWSEATPQGLKLRAGPKDGTGPVRTLGDWYDFGAGRSLVVDATHVYWLARSGVLQRLPKQGGEVTSLPLPPGREAGIGPIEDWQDAILVGGHSCQFVVRVPKDGSPPRAWPIIDKVVGGVTGFAAEGSRVYCASGTSIQRLDTSTGEVQVLTSGQSMAGPLVLDGDRLFFVNNRPRTGSGENLAVLMPGAAQAVDLGPVFGHVGRLNIDRARRTIHWVTGSSPVISHVGVYRMDEGRTELVLDRLDVMGSSAADETYLYWPADHAVMRLRK